MSATREMLRLVHAATKPMRTRISMMASRVVVNAIQDSPALQTATVEALAGELLDKIEHMQPGGLSHVAGKGAEGLMLCLGGSREAGIVFAVSNRSDRPTGLLEGETAVWTGGALKGTRILCKADGEIVITPDAAVGTPIVTVNGDVLATGQVTANGGSAATKVTLANHTHTTGAGPSGPPIIPEP